MAAELLPRLKQLVQAFIMKLLAAKDFIGRYLGVFRQFGLWIVHLPEAVATGISRWTSNTCHVISEIALAIEIAIITLLRGIAIVIIALVSITLLYYATKWLRELYRRYQDYKGQRAFQQRYQRMDSERDADERQWLLREQARLETTEWRARLSEELRLQEERLEQDRRRQAERKQQAKAQEEQRRRIDGDRRVYGQWLGQCEALLSCLENMNRFPDPPFWPCTLQCKSSKDLRACHHTIERLYRASGKPFQELLKQEVRRWHPDKFSKCPKSSLMIIQAKAAEMFKIIQGLIEKYQSDR